MKKKNQGVVYLKECQDASLSNDSEDHYIRFVAEIPNIDTAADEELNDTVSALVSALDEPFRIIICMTKDGS